MQIVKKIYLEKNDKIFWFQSWNKYAQIAHDCKLIYYFINIYINIFRVCTQCDRFYRSSSCLTSNIFLMNILIN